jgi:hypothetical protein
MYAGKLIFTQVIDLMPQHIFRCCVARYRGEHQVKSFTCRDQFLCMAFAQLTYRESLRDIEACLRAQSQKLYHMGIRGKISKSTLADANEQRDWRIYADLAYQLIATARVLYRSDQLDIELAETVYALDSTTIDLCLSMFPWANFRKAKGAIKLHTLLDLRGNIPSFISISDGKLHDVNVLDILPLEPGSFYVMDRGYLDFSRLFSMSRAMAFFVIRAKKNLKFNRVYSHPVDRETGIICDQTIVLAGQKTSKAYPEKLRRVKYHDAETDKTLVFLTNNFVLSPMTIAQLYRCRWQVELFFKWIKQNLRIKSFYGTSENAVKTQIWIAVSVYVLVAIMKKQLGLQPSLYTLLQILSVSAFERLPILQLLTDHDYKTPSRASCIQLNLFDNCSGH